MSTTRESADMMSAEAELRRIDHTATIWFAAAIVAVALTLAALILSGWRPAQLTDVAATAWWIGAALVAVGVAGVGYAGCPIYWGNVSVAHRQKSIAIRGGLVCFLLGGVVAIVAMLAG